MENSVSDLKRNLPNGGLSVEYLAKEYLGLPISNAIASEISEIAQLFPENPNSITPSYAQFLAARFLKGMDLCAELYAVAIGYETKLEIQKRREHGLAIISRSKNKGFKSVKEKEAYAFTDEEYIAVAEKHAEAKLFRTYIESKRKDFERAHYQMRKLADRDSDLEATDLNTNNDDKENSWQEWSENSTKRKSW